MNTTRGGMSVGTVLNFSAYDTITGEVSIAVAFKTTEGIVFTYTIVLPVDRAQGYAEKFNHAVNGALRFAPRRAGAADVD